MLLSFILYEQSADEIARAYIDPEAVADVIPEVRRPCWAAGPNQVTVAEPVKIALITMQNGQQFAVLDPNRSVGQEINSQRGK